MTLLAWRRSHCSSACALQRVFVSVCALGLSFRPHKNLSLGVGGSLNNRSSSIPEIYLPDATNQEETETNPQIEVKPELTPYFGVDWMPLGSNQWSISSSVHLPSQSRLVGAGQLRFWDFEYPEGQDALNQKFELAFYDEPLKVSLGSAGTFMLTQKQLTVYGDLLWSKWSEYTDRHLNQKHNWVDTLSARGGVSVLMDMHEVGAGFSYDPTPVPEQRGRTNYVDNTRAGLEMGWSWRLPVAPESGAISLGVSGQLLRFMHRSHKMVADTANPVVDELPDQAINAMDDRPLVEATGLQTNNPGFPGYSHAGWLSSIQLTLSIER